MQNKIIGVHVAKYSCLTQKDVSDENANRMNSECHSILTIQKSVI
jgi:hypothetical protein